MVQNTYVKSKCIFYDVYQNKYKNIFATHLSSLKTLRLFI